MSRSVSNRPLAHTTVSEIERGARRVDVDDLVAIAAALEVLPADLGVTDTMQVVSAYALDEILKIIEEAKRSNPEATKAALGESEVHGGND